MDLFKEIFDIAQQIYFEPELGFKEKNTHQIIENYIKKCSSDICIEKFSTTGIKCYLNSQKEKELKVALIAELDGVYAPLHMYANKKTGAAHNCGHYSQVAILLYIFSYYIKYKLYENLDYALCFIFLPAEEYLDIEYRKELREKKEIIHLCGKAEAMRLGVFDDIDAVIGVHSMGGDFSERSIEINCNLAGFLYKSYNFLGKPSHAGFAPTSGINAYSMSTLFNVGLGLFRQQIDDKYLVRINSIIQSPNMTINIIPQNVKIDCDIRAHSVEYLIELSKNLDNIADGSALSLGGKVEKSTEIGYLPFKQDEYLSTFVKKTFENFEEIKVCKENNPISAAGDIGDLSFMRPCIQVGYSGFKGTIHGNDFIHDDVEYIFSIFPKFMIEVLKNLSGKLDKNLLYKKTYEEYITTIDLLRRTNEK